MDPFLQTILGGFAGSLFDGLFGGIFGDNSAKKQFQYNQQLMQDQYRYNAALQEDAQSHSLHQMELQQDWQKKMMEMQNQWTQSWNTQSNIDQRLRDAGRNPYLTGASTGTVQSASPSLGGQSSAGTGSVGLPSSGMYQPNVSFSSAMTAFANAGVAQANQMKQMEEAKGMAIDNKTKYMQNLVALQKLMKEVKGTDLQNYLLRVRGMFAKDMAEQDYEQKLQQNKNLKLQGASMGFTIAMQAEQLKVLPTQLRMDLCMKNAQLYTEFQRGQLTEAQYKHELVKTMISGEHYKQEQVNTDVAEQTKDAKVTSEQTDSFRKVLDYDTAWKIAGYIVSRAKIEAYGSGPFGLNELGNAFRHSIGINW